MSHDRLATCFARCQDEGRAALIGYLTAGDPDPATSLQLLQRLARAVDIIEIGMPFSDPMADGPVIQAASERALAAGTHMDDVFRFVSELRASHPALGVVLMGYANTAFAPGYTRFAEEAARAGADGVLLVDLPPEESAAMDSTLHAHGLHSIRLLAPTSSEERIRCVAAGASGFIYYVSLTGITGARAGDITDIRRHVDAIRKHSALPVCVGFGIKTPAQARDIAAFADGVVIGSHFVQQISEHLSDSCAMIQSLGDAADKIRSALTSDASGGNA